MATLGFCLQTLACLFLSASLKNLRLLCQKVSHDNSVSPQLSGHLSYRTHQ